MARRAQDVYTEWRGGTCRVKWWSGEFLPSGRKRFESEGGFTDEDEALQYGQDKRYEIRHLTHVSKRDGSTLISDWADEWYASLDLAHLSMRNYGSAIRCHIKPFFEGKTVGEIGILDVRRFKAYLEQNLPSENSRRGVLMVFGMLMDDAVKARMRATSPIERERRRGRYTKKIRERKKDMPVGVVEAIAQNAYVRWGFAGYVFFWTMAMTGMRPAELYGLTREYCYPNWPASDPRPDKKEADRYEEDAERYGKGEGLMPAIRVERQVQYKDGVLQFFDPKYGSKRTLVVPPFLADHLERLLASHDSEYVFPGLDGGCLGHVAFDKEYWRPIVNGCDTAGEPRPRPGNPPVPSFKGKRKYLIRHGHKSWLDADGHSEFAKETRMGHEVQGVVGTYGSLTVEEELAIMRKLQERWETRCALTDFVAEPRPPRLSVAGVVRAALARGVTDPSLIVAEVHGVLPGAKRATVMRTVTRVRDRSSETA